MGQLAYFIEFIDLVWTVESVGWKDAPLSYASGNAPSKAEVLGTWTLSVLAGHQTLFARDRHPLRWRQSRTCSAWTR